MQSAVLVVVLLFAIALVGALDCTDQDAVVAELQACLLPTQGECVDGLNPIITGKCCKRSKLPTTIGCLQDVLDLCPNPNFQDTLNAAEELLEVGCVTFKKGKTNLITKKGKKAVRVEWSTNGSNCLKVTFTGRSGFTLRRGFAGVQANCSIPKGSAAFDASAKPKSGSKSATVTICPDEINGLARRCGKKICLSFKADVKSSGGTSIGASMDPKRCSRGKGGALACSSALTCNYEPV